MERSTENFNRKLKSLDNKTGRRIKATIENLLIDHEKYKNCYFWSGDNGNCAARSRRAFEVELTFYLNGVHYEVYQGFHQSRKNSYYSCKIYRNDKKSSITVLKNLL